MKLVIFTKNTARIFENVEDYNEVLNWPNAFLNPSLIKVGKQKPHFWTIKDGEIVPMNWIQRRVRALDIKKNGMDLRLQRLEIEEIQLLNDKTYEILTYASYASAVLNLILLYALGRSL